MFAVLPNYHNQLVVGNKKRGDKLIARIII